MESELETMKCNECKFFLNSPVMLPCGKSACQDHFNGKSYYCHSCGTVHLVHQNEFPPNNVINLPIDIYFNDFKRAETACESYKSNIDKFESLKNEPKYEIEKTLGEIKAKVRSIRDGLIKEIEFKSEQIILDLDKFQLECTNALIETENSMENVENRLMKAKLKLDTLLMDLKSLERESENYKLKSILDQCELESEKLVSFMGHVKKSLLLYRLDEFNAKLNEFSQFRLINVAERPFVDQIKATDVDANDVIFSSKIQNCSEMEFDGVNEENRSNQFQGEFYYSDDDKSDVQTIELSDDNESDEGNCHNTEMNEIRPSSSNFQDLSSSISNALGRKINDNKKKMTDDLEQTVTRLDENQVDEVFNNGKKLPKHFALRLLCKYFSSQERLVGKICGRGRGRNLQQLDPVRIGFIQSHVTSRNGGHLSDEQWGECLKYMISQKSNHSAYRILKKNLGIPTRSNLNYKGEKSKTRMSDEQVNFIFNNGNTSLAHFAARLFSRYFSINELVIKQMTKSRDIDSLDPVRIGLIKSHLQDRNGGPLSDEQWKQIRFQMYLSQSNHINYLKKSKNKNKND